VIYRTRERVYRNDTYYSRGVLESDTIKDADGNPIKATTFDYSFVDSTDGAPANIGSLLDSVYPRLDAQEHLWYYRPTHKSRRSTDVAKSTRTTYTYDTRGNMTSTTDFGEPGAADDVTADMKFTECVGVNDEFPWTQVAYSLLVRSGSDVLQRREADMPCEYAAVVQTRDHLQVSGMTPGQVAPTDVLYVDVGGQVAKVTGPPNIDGERAFVEYTFDEIGASPTTITDAHGLVTEEDHNPLFGTLAERRDPNGAKTTITYDERGRIEEIKGPLEQSGPPSIDFEYHDEADPAYAIARHHDEANGGTIDTVRFIDGLARDVQTKHEASVFGTPTSPAADVAIVSGHVWFDAFGRGAREYTPTVESRGLFETYTDTVDPDVPPRRMSYDEIDRETEVVNPNGSRTTDVYGFAQGPFGTSMFSNLERDKGGGQKITYVDVRDNVVAVERPHHDAQGRQARSNLTRYDYDPVNRLERVVDPIGATTTVTYDLMGRRTSIDNPDAGLVQTRFDLASNEVATITPKLLANGEAITYDYDHERLVGISYPDNEQNDVTYAYGDPGDPGNAAGLIASVHDGARVQARSYDLLGQLAEETTLMKVDDLSPANQSQHTFTTRFGYDTWGRMLTMEYPDGEVLTYTYDSGGVPSGVSGEKNGITYPYVDRLEYDQFGNRRLQMNGNGTSVQRTYDFETGFLTDQLTQSGSTVLQNLHYTYDAAGNVLEREDTRPIPPSSEKGGPSIQTFTYDDLYRLTSAEGTYRRPNNNREDYTLAMEYDGVGRVSRKSQVDESNGRVETSTSFDIAYDYDADQPHAPKHIGDETFDWDANGNLEHAQHDRTLRQRVVEWDEEDRPTKITDSDTNPITYRYDDTDDLAIRRTEDGDVEFVNEYYRAHDADMAWKNILIDGQPVLTKRAFLETNTPETTQFYFTSDLTESVNLVTNEQGELVEHYLYFPGGEFWVDELRTNTQPSPTVNTERKLFAGSYRDQDRAIDLMGARWYEPREGFMYSADPVVPSDLDKTVEQPQLLNAFTYANDNPLTYIDPRGTDVEVAQHRHQARTWVRSSQALPQRWAVARPSAPAPKQSGKLVGLLRQIGDKDAGEAIGDRTEFLKDPPLFELSFSLDGQITIAESPFKLVGLKTPFKFNVKSLASRAKMRLLKAIL
jgi:RHS repeat-associated protein